MGPLVHRLQHFPPTSFLYSFQEFAIQSFQFTMSQQDNTMMNTLMKSLMAQPELLKMLSDSLKTHEKSQAENASSEPAVTLVSQSVEIIVAPKVTPSSTPKRFSNPKEIKEGRSSPMPTQKWRVPVYETDPEEEKAVNAMRMELIGKTISGTFFMKDQPPHVKHWIRWNEKKCDNVHIPKDLAFEVFGGQPISGAKVRCTIAALGPDTATAWRKHPQCEMFEILPKSYISHGRSLTVTSAQRPIPSFRTVDTKPSVYRTVDTKSSNDTWMSRRTTARTNGSTINRIPSLSTLPTVRGSHLTACFSQNEALNWRNSVGSMDSISEHEG